MSGSGKVLNAEARGINIVGDSGFYINSGGSLNHFEHITENGKK